MNSEFPEKWKDTIDPMKLDLHNVKITEIIGYPHAANQVFVVKGIKDGVESKYVLKYADHIDSNIKNEVDNISLLKLDNIPNIIEYDNNYTYRISDFLEGEKLSTIVGDNVTLESNEYMYEFGKMLALLHTQTGAFSKAPHRRFHEIQEKEYFHELNLLKAYDYLNKNKPNEINLCFVHGDFHYANILWQNHQISAILDFELSGIGNKEFDIAWSLILRPSQKFLKTKKEIDEYLKGYSSLNNYNESFVKYYMILIYSWFIKFGDDEYKTYVREWILSNI